MIDEMDFGWYHINNKIPKTYVLNPNETEMEES